MKHLGTNLLVLAIIMFAETSAFASYSYDFNVNTSSLIGLSGYIDLQFNPGATSTGSAAASITNFFSDATLAAVILTGDVTGALPAAVQINNTTQFNDYFQALTFGKSMYFNLGMNGSAAGNSFYLSFLGNDGSTPLLTNDMTNGYATIIDIKQSGAAVTNNSNQVTVSAAAPTPIPPAALLFGTGLLGIFGIREEIGKLGSHLTIDTVMNKGDGRLSQNSGIISAK